MKTLALLILGLATLALALPAGAGAPRDNDGNLLIVDPVTAATPGAGEGLGAIVGTATDTLSAWEKHRFDLRLNLTGVGTGGDEDASSETVVTGVSLFYRPTAVPWLRVGPALAWDAVDRGKVSLGIPIGFKLFPDPYSPVIWWLNVDVLPTFVVRTTDLPDGVERESAITWAPGAAFLMEIPMSLWSVEVGAGARFPFSIEGVTDQSANQAIEQLGVGATVAVNFRLGR